MKQRSDDKRRKRREIGRTARTHRADMGRSDAAPVHELADARCVRMDARPGIPGSTETGTGCYERREVAGYCS